MVFCYLCTGSDAIQYLPDMTYTFKVRKLSEEADTGWADQLAGLCIDTSGQDFHGGGDLRIGACRTNEIVEIRQVRRAAGLEGCVLSVVQSVKREADSNWL